MLDPKTVLIQGDLSRADVVELVNLCKGQSVVEFGMGGSTLLLAQCAKDLASYDTNLKWYRTTRHRISQIADKSCNPKLIHNPKVPKSIPRCDVLFIDGLSGQRSEWGRKFFDRPRKAVIVHDSRRAAGWGMISKIIDHGENALWIDDIRFHAGDSNMVIIRKRPASVKYVNWNSAEKDDNRARGFVRDYLTSRPVRPYPVEWDDQGSDRLKRYRDTFVHGREASGLIRKHLTSGKPCSIVSLGDAEVKWWAGKEMRDISGMDADWLRTSGWASGFTGKDWVLARAFDAAIRNSPILLIQYHWPAMEMLTLEALKRKGLWLAKPHVDCNAVYRMNEWGDFFPILENRRVLIVGGYAERQARVMSAKRFQRDHRECGCIDGYEIVGHVQTPSRSQKPKHEYKDRILKAVDAVKFDLALVSAGGFAFIVCDRIRKNGGTAFDCGSLDRMILGEKRKSGSDAFRTPERTVDRNGDGIAG